MSARRFFANFAGAAALTLIAVNAQATGMMSCDSGPRESWRPMEELRTTLNDAGWEVRKIKIDEGCYEVYGVTPEGQRVEAYFDPVAFEKLLVARRGEILFRKAE